MKCRWIVRITCVVAFLASLESKAQFPTEWEWRSPQPTGNFVLSVAYANDTWVAVGELGYIGTSTDGVFWSQADTPAETLLTKIQFAAGMWVIVGLDGQETAAPTGGSDHYR